MFPLSKAEEKALGPNELFDKLRARLDAGPVVFSSRLWWKRHSSLRNEIAWLNSGSSVASHWGHQREAIAASTSAVQNDPAVLLDQRIRALQE